MSQCQIKNNTYDALEEVQEDLDQMITNCKVYNEDGSEIIEVSTLIIHEKASSWTWILKTLPAFKVFIPRTCYLRFANIPRIHRIIRFPSSFFHKHSPFP